MILASQHARQRHELRRGPSLRSHGIVQFGKRRVREAAAGFAGAGLQACAKIRIRSRVFVARLELENAAKIRRGLSESDLTLKQCGALGEIFGRFGAKLNCVAQFCNSFIKSLLHHQLARLCGECRRGIAELRQRRICTHRLPNTNAGPDD